MAKQNRRKRAATRIRQAHSRLKSHNTREQIQFFLTEYFLCEMACKEMVVGHQDSVGNNIKYGNVRMDYRLIRLALNHYGITVADEIIKRLFSSNPNSAKKIRDSLVHSLSKESIRKLDFQYGQLMNDIQTFLDAVEF